MKSFQLKRAVISAGMIALMATTATTASAQLLGGAGNTATKVTGQVQSQVQAQVNAQVQARLQADATRAAQIAQRAALATQQQATAAVQSRSAAARQRAAGGLNVRLATSTNVKSINRVGGRNAGAEANAKTYTRLGLDTSLRLPSGITKSDVQIYDNIFGKFNPLRAQPTAAQQPEKPLAAKPATTSIPVADKPAQNDAPEPDAPKSPRRADQRAATDALVSAQNEISLTSRINVAARQRRAEISEVRDRALATSDTQLMLKAQKMDDALKAFVAAQAEASAKARANAERAQGSVRGTKRRANAAGSAAGSAAGKAAGSTNKPAASASGNGQANGSTKAKTAAPN